jgi:hypothetical protein
MLKGHGNKADFLGFLQKLVPHRSLAQPFEPFRFWLRIRADIRMNVEKKIRRVGESLWNCYSNFLEFIIKLQYFKRLNQHFKDQFSKK